MTDPLPQEIARYKYVIVDHDRQAVLLKTLTQKIADRSAQNVFAITGPTGVGKSTLLKLIERDLNRPMHDSNGPAKYIPAVRSKIRPGQRELFDWKIVFSHALNTMNIRKSDLGTERRVIRASGRHSFQTHRLSGDELMRALLNAFQERNTSAWLLDEGGKIARGTTLAVRQQRLDILSDFADSTNAAIVIGGTYEMLDLLTLSDQLGRRLEWDEYQRYTSVGSDLQEFCNIAIALAEHSPIPFMVSPQKQIDWLYRQTLGCTGILHTLFFKAVSAAFRSNSSRVLKIHLEQSALRRTALEIIAKKILEGEEAYRRSTESTVRRLIASDRGSPR